MVKLLILGGTAEAAALAETLAGRQGCDVILSLAGRTAAPPPTSAQARRGGFGGADGLSAYLTSEHVTALLDATHPFATRISEHAALACRAANIPRLALLRPPWHPGAGEDWHHVADETEAAARLPAGARAFLALGRQRLAAFAPRSDVWFLVRVVDRPDQPLLPGPHLTITGRGPFKARAERELLKTHAISHLVTRNSGGEGARAKLTAARELALPVIMIARPAPPPEPVVRDTSSALAWLNALLR